MPARMRRLPRSESPLPLEEPPAPMVNLPVLRQQHPGYVIRSNPSPYIHVRRQPPQDDQHTYDGQIAPPSTVNRERVRQYRATPLFDR